MEVKLIKRPKRAGVGGNPAEMLFSKFPTEGEANDLLANRVSEMQACIKGKECVGILASLIN